MGTWNGIELDDLVIASERLTFRPWREADADEVAAIMAAPALHEHLPLPDPYTRQDAQQFVTGFGVRGRRDGSGIAGAVVETATGRLAGAAEMRLPGRREVSGEVGYWVRVSAQGKGYAAEVTRALAGWAFANGVQRLEIRCAVGNLASAKTALAAGFQFEAISRRREMTPRGPQDGALFARLAGDPDQPIAAAFPPLSAGDLSDGTVGLRVVTADDLDAVHAERVNEEAMRWAFRAEAPARAESERFAAHSPLRWLVGPYASLAIVEMASGTMAGIISVHRFGPPRVGRLSYGVLPRFRGRGYTARALRLLAPWAFHQAGFARLELGAKVDNVASQEAALAAGFIAEGVLQARLANPDGTFSDEARFALVNPVDPDVSQRA